MSKALRSWFLCGGLLLWTVHPAPVQAAATDSLATPLARTSPDWFRSGGQDGAWFGMSVAPAGDVNGDGYPDVLVGARGSDLGQGRAYLYFGSPAGLSSAPAWVGYGDQIEGEFGFPVASAGDVNHDGYDDVLIGARDYDTSSVDAGRAYLYLGSPTGLSATPAWTLDGTQASESLGQPIGGAGDVNGDGYDDVIVGAYRYDGTSIDDGRVLVFLGSTTGLSSLPAWTMIGDQAGAHLGSCASAAGDVNGDGYADIVIGAYMYNHKYVDEGRAYVFLGSAQGLSATPVWIGEGGEASCKYGASVSTAGDVNGDGYSDLIVGAPDYTLNYVHEGAAFVYLGSSSGPSPSPDWVAYGQSLSAFLGRSVACAGDTDGNGIDDVIVGASGIEASLIYRGSAGGLSANPSRVDHSPQLGSLFGYSCAGAGDVNRDGFGDVLVGAAWYDEFYVDEGAAFLFLGTSSLPTGHPAWAAEGGQAGGEFGLNVAPAGDVNGDGYPDLLIGARYFDSGRGRAFVYLGGPSGLSSTPAWIAVGDQVGGELGFPATSAGDVNHDGYGDVLVAARNYDTDQVDAGRAYLYLGSPTGLSATPVWTLSGRQAGENLGHPISGAGDVDGDGYDDVMVGAYRFDGTHADDGRVMVFLGSSTGLSATSAWTMVGDQAGAYFGTWSSPAGDVNGDGYADIMIGAYLYDHKYLDEGRAYVYCGSAQGLSTTPAWIGEGGEPSCKYGAMVSTAGDLNGDGYSDVIVGAPDYSRTFGHEGAAFVYLGSATGLSPTPDWAEYGQQTHAYFGRSVANVGDANLDGFDDVLVGASGFTDGQNSEGAAFLFAGSSAFGSASSIAWLAQGNQEGSIFGYSTAGVGDVDGDGFADIVVGAPWYGNPEVHEGAAFLYLGGPDILSDVPPAAGDGIAQPLNLEAPRPNPFGPWSGATSKLSVSFRTPSAGPIRLSVFDLTGRCVTTLLHSVSSGGRQTVEWDGRSDLGRPVPSGVYFFRLDACGRAATSRVVVTR
jgi:hypothetical protein